MPNDLSDILSASDALASIIARCRFGSGVDMGGAHNPRPSEAKKARQFIEDLIVAGWKPPVRATGAKVDPALIPPTRKLGSAMGEVGRIIESLPPSDRVKTVKAVLDSMNETERTAFIAGVFVYAHTSLAKEDS